MSAELAADVRIQKKVGGNKVNDYNFDISQFYDVGSDISIKSTLPAPTIPLKNIIVASQNFQNDDEYANPVYDPEIWKLLENRYKYGMTAYTDWENSLAFYLNEPKFDIDVKHLYATADRMNFNIHFYDDNNVRLGYFEYHKNNTTWNTGNYTTIIFRDDSGTILANFPASLFSGTGKGNAGFRQTVDFTDNTKIQLFTFTSESNYTYTNADHEISVIHTLNNTKYLISEITYSSCTTAMAGNGSYVTNNVANANDIFGPLDER